MSLSLSPFTVLLLVSAAVPLHAKPDHGPSLRAKPQAQAMEGIMAQPKEALLELRRLYARYADVVQRRIEEGWRAGLLSGSLIEHGEASERPARQVEEALKNRERELREIEAALPEAETPAAAERRARRLEAKRAEVRALRRDAQRPKGTCLDWSDEAWSELSRLASESWSLQDESRHASPRHTAAVACTPASEPEVCLALDPWKRGEPDVYEYHSWSRGSFEGRIAATFFLHRLPEP